MLRRTLCSNLRYLHAVKARPGPGAESIIKADDRAIAQHASQMMHANETISTLHHAAQLRIGGAKFLQTTTQTIFNNNDDHPLFFAQRAPRKAGLCPSLCTNLYKLDIKELTELQGALIPLLLKGRHVIAHAETGSGKSFGIALAVANRVARDNINYRLHTLILVPTTELALQYDKWLKHFAGAASQVVQVAVDEIPLEKQLAKLHNIQPHVIVGTLQRVSQIVAMAPSIVGEKLRKKIDTVILDEADILLQEPLTFGGLNITGADLIDKIYRNDPMEVPAQMVATSATIDGATSQRLNSWMANENVVRLTTSFVEHTIPNTINFYFFAASRRHEPIKCLENTLRLIYYQNPFSRVLVFTSDGTEDGADRNAENEVREVCEEINKMNILRKKRRRVGPGEDPDEVARCKEMEVCKAVVLADDTNVNNMKDGRKRDHSKHHSRTLQPGRVAAAASRALDQQQQQQGGNGYRRNAATDANNTKSGYSSKQIKPRRRDVIVQDASNLSALSQGRVQIGVAPYALGRGLHITGVTHVIIYSKKTSPPSREFVHCAGRTGRMGRDGDCIVIFPPSRGRAMQQVVDAFQIPWHMSRISDVERLLEIAKEDRGIEYDENTGDVISTTTQERVADAANTTTTSSVSTDEGELNEAAFAIIDSEESLEKSLLSGEVGGKSDSSEAEIKAKRTAEKLRAVHDDSRDKDRANEHVIHDPWRHAQKMDDIFFGEMGQ